MVFWPIHDCSLYNVLTVIPFGVAPKLPSLYFCKKVIKKMICVLLFPTLAIVVITPERLVRLIATTAVSLSVTGEHHDSFFS
jgi:hypothetical protein